MYALCLSKAHFGQDLHVSGYLENISILVVDDNTFTRRLSVNILRCFGARDLEQAEDGEDAKNHIVSRTPDIVLTDWVMPPHNGIDLARWVRTGDGSPDPFLPIIMMSGYSDLERVAEARDAGVNEFLVKPMSPKNLMRRVQAVVEKPRSYIRHDAYFGPERRRRELPFIGADKRDDGMDHTREDSKLRKATRKS